MPATSRAEFPQPPPPERFSRYPASWYRFGASGELRETPVSREMLGRKLVAWRLPDRTAVVMDANCAHLGADLGCGRVVDGALHCPFHDWTYGADGRCRDAPGEASPPHFARLQAYPAEERHGQLFFFNGPRALFPLPFVIGEEAAAYATGALFQYTTDCIWYVNSAHAFDTRHFLSVHDRRLLAPPAVDCPAPYARRNHYRAEVLGHTMLDRFLRHGAGRSVEITLTVWGGTFAIVTARFNRVKSAFLMITRPLPDGATLCEGLVLERRPRSRVGRALWLPLSLFVRRFFTHGYLRAEAARLRDTRYSPERLGEADRDMIEYFRWLAALPQTAAPAAEAVA